jgi:opacity protein-like surface antigen
MSTMANSGRTLQKLGLTTAALAAAWLLAPSAARADEPQPSPAGSASASASAKPSAPPAGELIEDPLKRYYFLGVRFRDIVVPQFMINLFAAGGTTGNVFLVGPELSMRKDSTEIDISLAYADYGYGPAMFKGKNDPDESYEMITSTLKLGYLTFDLLYDVPIDKKGMFSFLIGGGVGVAFVAGDLYRVQAYPTGGGAADPSDAKKWAKCSGPGDGVGAYCSNPTNDHYSVNGKDYSEKSWADGGSKPLIFPWISLPQLSFRFKPIKQLQTRADVGFSVSGFFFGLSAGYGF